jgi:pimeloyl-ACP methyl ester carboxylesterase
MIAPLEAAGYGIVLYDFPFNRPLEESCDHFAEDWVAFREQTGERRPWAIVAHSMGALVARSYIEDDALWRGDVNSLILIAPVSQGSNLAKAQPVLQFVNSLKAVNGGDTSAALARLSDGLGKAADDILPSSDFLATLNRRPRRKSVNYHILAGDTGILRPKERQEIEHRLGLLTKNAGLLGTFARKATADVPAILDELTDGTGDGCVTVESTRLPGVDDHVTIHANHAELIRAPLLFSDDGPVACMPDVLRWLRADTASQRGPGQAPSGRRRRPASPAP